MQAVRQRPTNTASNHTQTITRPPTARAVRCGANATRPKGDRVIAVNHRLDLLRCEARELLMSEEGLRHRSRRPIEPEAVFGQMKFNMGYKRFRHVGEKLCNMDFGIFAIAFNLLKLSRLKGFKWDDFLRRMRFIAFLCRYLIRGKLKKAKVVKFDRMERRWQVENAA